jgi:hypothetical protein
MILLGVALLLAAAMAIFVTAPLLATERGEGGILPIDVTPLADLKRRRLVVYENLQDLEFEYKAGKISPDDYQALRVDYVAEAAQLMAASQEAEHLSEDDVVIEREVTKRRAQRRLRPAEEYTCPKCGFENPVPVKFCGECGARVPGRKG